MQTHLEDWAVNLVGIVLDAELVIPTLAYVVATLVFLGIGASTKLVCCKYIYIDILT